MNLDYIEAFVYVVHYNSIHKAADALFLSQPTVTARIKALERELDVELFERQGRSITLTEKGKMFVPYAEQILRTYQQGKKQMKKRADAEEVVIGANPIASQYFVPFAMPLWKKSHPELRFKLVSGPNDLLMDKLLQKQIDLALMKELSHPLLQQEPLLDNSIRLVVRPGHPFQFQPRVSVHQLALEPIVFYECGAFDWNRIHKIFEVENVEPRIEFQVEHLEVAKSLIQSGCGIGFLPYLCVKQELESGRLAEVNVEHLLMIKQYIHGIFYGPEPPAIWSAVLSTVERFNRRSSAPAFRGD